MILFFLFITQIAQAEWIRTQLSTPLREQKNLLVATYLNRGNIDHTIPNSAVPFYMTVVFDLKKNPPKIYSKVSTHEAESNATHHLAEEWLLFQKPKQIEEEKTK